MSEKSPDPQHSSARRRWRDLDLWVKIAIIATPIVAIIAIIVPPKVIGSSSSATSSQPPVETTGTGATPQGTSAASPPSQSAPAPSATPNSAVYWSGPVGITTSGLEFDTRPPSQAGVGYGIAYYADSDTLWTNPGQNIVVSLWTNSGTPSAAQCQSWVSTHPNNEVASPTPGMNICIETAASRIGRLQIDSGTNNGQLQATATIWDS